MRSASQHAIGISNQIALQIVSRRMSAELCAEATVLFAAGPI
jgi:hypothetical protein